MIEILGYLALAYLVICVVEAVYTRLSRPSDEDRHKLTASLRLAMQCPLGDAMEVLREAGIYYDSSRRNFCLPRAFWENTSPNCKARALCGLIVQAGQNGEKAEELASGDLADLLVQKAKENPAMVMSLMAEFGKSGGSRMERFITCVHVR